MSKFDDKQGVINKGLDIFADSTKQTRGEIDKNTSKGVNKLAQLLWSTPLGIKADVYIQERPYKLEKSLNKMKKKYNIIPPEYRTEPTSFIALKGVTELGYCLEEEHLKEMFENLLVSDMDNRKQSKVLPSYIEVVKQLSKDDAQMLKFFKANNIINEPIMKIKYIYNNKGYNYSSNNLFLIIGSSYKILDSIVMDNLLRLKLVNIPTGEHRNNLQLYEQVFEQIKQRDEFSSLPPLVEKLDYKKGVIQITDFGKNFIDICLS